MGQQPRLRGYVSGAHGPRATVHGSTIRLASSINRTHEAKTPPPHWVLCNLCSSSFNNQSKKRCLGSLWVVASIHGPNVCSSCLPTTRLEQHCWRDVRADPKNDVPTLNSLSNIWSAFSFHLLENNSRHPIRSTTDIFLSNPCFNNYLYEDKARNRLTCVLIIRSQLLARI